MARKYKRLKYSDRQILEQMGREHRRIADIAETLDVHRDTIYKELARCEATLDTYSADEAQKAK